MDQRGCGSSTPVGCLVDNNTQALVDDYEKLRKQLKIRKWMLFGGSWGVALSLAYAQQHPHKSAPLSCMAVPTPHLHSVCVTTCIALQLLVGK